MAKGNLFLGTASKSVGDITLMRRNGQQVARVRVRKIANPKSAGQVRQRMMLAAVSRFYAPLSSCLEQSFEGLTKMQSYSKFLQTNMRLARAYGVAVPKDAGFIPLPFRVSSGTMPSANYYYNSDADAGFVLDIGASLGGAAITVANLSQALIVRYGLEEGDQVTFIWSLQDGEPDTGGEHVYNVQYRRFWIDTTDTSAFTMGTLIFGETDGNLLINEDNDWLRGFAVIFSHWENGQWRRSNQLMAVAAGIDVDYMGEEAFKEYYPEWTRSTAEPSSDVYLNGSLVHGAPNFVTVTLNGTQYTFVGYAQRNIGGVDYMVLLGSDGKDYYLKCMNEKSDMFGQYITYAAKDTVTLSDTPCSNVAPAGIPAAQIVELDNLDDAIYPQLQSLTSWAINAGWTPVGATVVFAPSA